MWFRMLVWIVGIFIKNSPSYDEMEIIQDRIGRVDLSLVGLQCRLWIR